jgi:hypothetical protein
MAIPSRLHERRPSVLAGKAFKMYDKVSTKGTLVSHPLTHIHLIQQSFVRAGGYQ